jgi:membrane-bound lytic murein transglycosylase D
VSRDAEDLWDRIRGGLRYAGSDRPEVEKEVRFYSRYNEFIGRTTQRARPFLHHIVEELERRQMPLDLALLPIVESAFQPAARSRSGAVGIWQFIPATGRRFGLERNHLYDGRRDVIASTTAALDYLQELHDQFDGDWLSAVAAYNCGERNVERAIAANRAAGRPTDFWSLDLPRETRIYVPRLLALTTIVASPLRYDVKLEPIANEPYLAVVEVAKQIDLSKAATRAGLDGKELRALNPGYTKGVTTTAGIHKVAVPIAKMQVFKDTLAQHIADLGPDRKAARAADRGSDAKASGGAGTQRHRVRSGENLGLIASRYDVTVEAIQELNSVHPRRLRIGQSLLIPVADGGEDAERVAAAEAAVSNSSDAMSEVSATATENGRKVIHTVRSGDSLWTIARSYDVRVKDIVAWNDGLSAKAVLRLNQKLVVWTAGAEERVADADAGGALVKTSAAVASDGAFKLVRYEIRTGDSLWTIAQRFKVSVDQLRLWNGIGERKTLRPGESIDVYVVSADTAGAALRI